MVRQCLRLCPPYGACVRFPIATAMRSNVAFIRRVSASCCSASSGEVAPQRLRERRDNHTHKINNAMNGSHETKTAKRVPGDIAWIPAGADYTAVPHGQGPAQFVALEFKPREPKQ